MQTFQEKAGNAIEFLTEKIRAVDLTPFIEKIKTAIQFTSDMFDKFTAFGKESGIFDAVKESLNAAIPLFKDTFELLSNNAKKFVEIAERTGLFDKIATGIKAVVPFFKTVLSVMETIFNLLERIGVFDAIAKGIGFVIDTLVKMGDKFTEIWNTIKPFIDGIKDFADLTGKISKFGSKLFSQGVEAVDADAKIATVEERVGGLQRDAQELIQDTTRKVESFFSGVLNITGAPEGSTFTPGPGSNNDIDVNLLGHGR